MAPRGASAQSEQETAEWNERIGRARLALVSLPSAGFDFEVNKSQESAPDNYEKTLETRMLLCAVEVWRKEHGSEFLPLDAQKVTLRRIRMKVQVGTHFKSLPLRQIEYSFSFDFGRDYVDHVQRTFDVLLPQEGNRMVKGKSLNIHAFRGDAFYSHSSGERTHGAAPRTYLQADILARSPDDVERFDNSSLFEYCRVIPREILTSIGSSRGRWALSLDGDCWVAERKSETLDDSLPFIRRTLDHAPWGSVRARFDAASGALVEFIQHDALGDKIEEIRYGLFDPPDPSGIAASVHHRTWYHGDPSLLRSEITLLGKRREVRPPVSIEVLIPAGCTVSDRRVSPSRDYVQPTRGSGESATRADEASVSIPASPTPEHRAPWLTRSPFRELAYALAGVFAVALILLAVLRARRLSTK